MNKFQLISQNQPAGDQPQAIKELVVGLQAGLPKQTLLGVTGSGKTFTIANIIAQTQRPALVIAHNKTLAAQLCNEFRELFPKNAVHYFVSYYDYYQPEAYLPHSDTYIDKEAMINDEIDKLRHAATTDLLTRPDVIIVASVSCIYGLGQPEVYAANLLSFKVGDILDRQTLLKKLVNLQFTRTTSDLKRGSFRLRGENWEIMPAGKETIFRLEITAGHIQTIYAVDPVKGFQINKTPTLPEVVIGPAKHFITPAPERVRALKLIRQELKERLNYFQKRGMLLEAERLERRTNFDLAMIENVGYCHGIENYSQPLSGRPPGEAPSTLLDYFPSPPAGGFLTIIDESHVTVPQLQGMFHGDNSRKRTLIDYGFRLPSALDNRPLRFHEFEKKISQVIYTSATPSEFEMKKSQKIVEQIIRPTGLVDPKVTILPARGQVDDVIAKIKSIIKQPAKKRSRVLITTLTKKMAEDLSGYLAEMKIKVTYLHSDIKTLDRIRILTDLRRGKIDVLVGVNLLREGLDLPEVSLVAILDADKEGFLRSETSLIQTIGRAARNVDGQVLLYADHITGSIKRAVSETDRRRTKQLAYNVEHQIVPKTIIRAIKDILPTAVVKLEVKPIAESPEKLGKLIKDKEKEMRLAAGELNFELAAILRDEIKLLQRQLKKIL